MVDRSNFIGKEIGSYRIISEINSGAYGAVFQGKHVIFDDEPIVAIKLLHAHLSSEEAREQFIQEARILRKLDHLHILPILNAGIQDGIPYLVTEYTSGGSLRDKLKLQSGMPLPVDEALIIITQRRSASCRLWYCGDPRNCKNQGHWSGWNTCIYGP